MNNSGLSKSIALAALISLPGIVLAGESVNESLAAEADGVVEIHNIRGRVRVVGWDKNEVKISGELDDMAKKLVFESQGKVILIRVEMPKRNVNRGDGSDLVINVPNTNHVDFSGVSTDVYIKDVSAGIGISSVSGEVDVVNVKRQLFINTVSGDISLKESSGKAKLSSVSGDVKGEFDSKEVTANSVSGDIQLHLQDFDNLDASNVSGDVWISGQLLDSGATRLSSVSGNISLAFDRAVNARVSVNTGPGGRITNNISSDEIKKVFPGQQKLNMTLGDGSGRIKIGTVSGTISLRGSNN